MLCGQRRSRSVVVVDARERDERGRGFNANERYEDLVAAGVIDLAKVVRSAPAKPEKLLIAHWLLTTLSTTGAL